MRNRLAAMAACLSLATAYPAAAQPQSRLAPDTSWVSRSAIYEVFVRDFSPAGNLRGVTAGLGRLQSVGADVLWLMPIYPVGVLNRKEPLGSPYSVSDYRAINPAFGTAADFRALVRAVHARGMKLILDWVPNHTSWVVVNRSRIPPGGIVARSASSRPTKPAAGAPFHTALSALYESHP